MKLPPPASQDPVCIKCGYHVDVFGKGVRLLNKTTPQYACAKCNSRTSQLYSVFGSWPVAEFRELTEGEQQSFWRAQAHGKEDLKSLVSNTLVKKLVESRMASDAGPFLPLSVWEKQGYDPEVIRQKAKHEMHPVLGDTYQVRIHTDGIEKREDMIRQHLLELMNRNPKKTCGASLPEKAGGRTLEEHAGEEAATSDMIEPAQKKPKKKKSSSSSESSTTSSSSSSSTSGDGGKDRTRAKQAKQKKLQKKLKKQEKKAQKKEKKLEAKRVAKLKDEAKQQAIAEKAEKARIAKIKSDANKVLTRTTGPSSQLDALNRDENVKKIPEQMQNTLQAAVATLKSFHTEAKKASDAKKPDPYEPDMEAIANAVKDAKHISSSVRSMLSILDKATS